MPSGYSKTEVSLKRSDLKADPVLQFTQWLQDAISHGELEPTAMTLATVNKAYEVSARMVLLKQHSPTGFVFFTNYHSPKAHCLTEVPHAALVFWWPIGQRQVRITGTVNRTSPEISDNYFRQREKASQIAALASEQSQVIAERAVLLKNFDDLTEVYKKTESVPRPAHWGGYILTPVSFEFWQGSTHRLHDRFAYQRSIEGDWQITRLSP